SPPRSRCASGSGAAEPPSRDAASRRPARGRGIDPRAILARALGLVARTPEQRSRHHPARRLRSQAVVPDTRTRMRSLWRETGRLVLPPCLLVLAGATLAAGLRLPVLTVRTGLAHEHYSVLGGIADLAHSGEVLLALIVLAFSVVFPIAELGALAFLL